MADLVTRLRLDNREFDENIRRSRQLLEGLNSSGNIAQQGINNLLGSFKGMIAGLGTISAAMAVFDAAVNSSADSQKDFRIATNTAKTSVNDFFSAIRTGDWSNFKSGIVEAIKLAGDYLKAMEVIKNGLPKMDAYKDQKDAELDELDAKINNPKAKASEKESAWRDYKTKYYELESTIKDTLNSLKETISEIAKKAGISLKTDNDFNTFFKSQTITSSGLGYSSKMYNRYKELLDKGADKEFTGWDSNAYNGGSTKAEYEKYVKAGTPEKAKLTGYAAERIREHNEYLAIQKHHPEVQMAYKMNNMGIDEDDLSSLLQAMQTMAGLRSNLASRTNEFNSHQAEFDKNGKWKDDKKESGGGKTETPVPEGSIADLEKQIADKKLQLSLAVDESSRRDLNKDIKELEEKVRVIKFRYEHEDSEGSKPVTPKRGSLASMAKIPDMNIKLPKNNTKGLDGGTKAANDYAAALTNCASAIANFNGQKLEDNGEGWTQWSSNLLAAAASTIIGLQSLTMAKGVNSAFDLPFPANLAAAALVLSTVISLFASIPAFAEGGIFESTLTTGDRNIARLNGGEMILNKGQLYNLFKLLDNGSSINGGGEVTFKLRGSDIYGSLTNYNKKFNKVR